MIDLIKFNKPEQFPKDEIINEKDRLVRSWMSVEVTDSQGDIVPVTQLKRCLTTWFKRGATMIDQHTNRPIGKGLHWREAIHPESKKPGVILDYQVFDDYSVDHQVWEEIKNGDRTGLSIGGRATGKPKMKEDDYTGNTGKYLQGLELYEVSPVDNPANQLGKNVAINYLAKSMGDAKKTDIEKQLMKDLEKGYAGDMEQNFGGFKNFEECVDAQKLKGHSDDSAKRVCGLMMHETEKRFLKNKNKESKTIEDYNWDPDMDNIAHIGYMTENEEHPQLDEEGIKQVVVDHLSEDPTYYDKKKAEYLKTLRKGAIKKSTSQHKEDKIQKGWSDTFIKSLNEVKKSPDSWPGEFVKRLQNQKI